MEKRGIASQALPWTLIAIAALVLSLVIVVALRDKGNSAIDTILNLFKGR